MRRGKRLGKYRLERRIGSGSFAEVWKARDTIEQRDVALKIATPGIIDLHGKKEIEHEARIASKLTHPNIVTVRNADWVDGHFVLATDLAEKNLAQYAGAKRSEAVALRVIRACRHLGMADAKRDQQHRSCQDTPQVQIPSPGVLA